jgi:hypothetical protein
LQLGITVEDIIIMSISSAVTKMLDSINVGRLAASVIIYTAFIVSLFRVYASSFYLEPTALTNSSSIVTHMGSSEYYI